MMEEKKLSIIVPVYNVEKHVGQCLDSLFESDVDDTEFEVIVVNDGTKDNSMEIVETIAERHTNIHIINQETQGLSVARNTGLEASRGEFVWFVDSDDWVSDNAVKRVISILEAESKTDVVTTPLLWCYTNNSRNYVDITISADTTLSGIEYIKTIGYTGAIPRNIIRRSILDRANIRFYPGILHEDGLFGPEMFYQAQHVHVVKEPFYNYRQREDGSIMHDMKIRSAYDMLTVYRALMKYCNEYVRDDDKLWWRETHILCFDIALLFAWHLRNTSEFKQFMKETAEFRKNECRCLLSCEISLTSKAKVWLIGHYPMLFRKIKKSLGFRVARMIFYRLSRARHVV